TVAFAPTSATSDGGKSMLTVTVSPTAMAGTTPKFTITATGMSSAHTTDVQVAIVAPPDMAMLPDLAQPQGGGGNGGSGGGGNGGTGGGGGGTGTGGNGNGGSGDHGGASGCSIGPGTVSGCWGFA